MVRKTVAELLVDVLAEAGVERVYGVPGDSLNGITDSIRVRQDVSWMGVRHEEAAAFRRRRRGPSHWQVGSMCRKLWPWEYAFD